MNKKEVTISITGLDRSGKTTLGKMLVGFFDLQGIEVHWKDPMDDWIEKDPNITANSTAIPYDKLDRNFWRIKLISY